MRVRVDVQSPVAHEAEQRDATFSREIDRQARWRGDGAYERNAGEECQQYRGRDHAAAANGTVTNACA